MGAPEESVLRGTAASTRARSVAQNTMRKIPMTKPSMLDKWPTSSSKASTKKRREVQELYSIAIAKKSQDITFTDEKQNCIEILIAFHSPFSFSQSNLFWVNSIVANIERMQHAQE